MAETNTTAQRHRTDIGSGQRSDVIPRITRVANLIDAKVAGGPDVDLSDSFDNYAEDEFVTEKFNANHLGVLFDDNNDIFSNVLNGLNFYVDEDGSLKVSGRSTHIEEDWVGHTDTRAGDAGDLVLSDFKNLRSLTTLIDSSNGLDVTERKNLVEMIRMLAYDTREQKNTWLGYDEYSNGVSNDTIDFLSNYLETLASKPGEQNKQNFYAMLKIIDEALATDTNNPDGVHHLLTMKPDLDLWQTAYNFEKEGKEPKTEGEKIKLVEKAVNGLVASVRIGNSETLRSSIKEGVSKAVNGILTGTDLDKDLLDQLKEQIATNDPRSAKTTLANLLQARKTKKAEEAKAAQEARAAIEQEQKAKTDEAQKVTEQLQDLLGDDIPQDLLVKLKTAILDNNGGTRKDEQVRYLLGEFNRFIEGKSAGYADEFTDPSLANPADSGVDVDPQLVKAFKLFLSPQTGARSLEQIFDKKDIDTAVEEIYNTVTSSNFTHPDRDAFFNPNSERTAIKGQVYAYNPATNGTRHPLLAKLGVSDLGNLANTGMKLNDGDILDADSVPADLRKFMTAIYDGDEDKAMAQIRSSVTKDANNEGRLWFDYRKFEQAVADELGNLTRSDKLDHLKQQLKAGNVNVDEMFTTQKVGRDKEEIKKALIVFLHRIKMFNAHYRANIDPDNQNVTQWANYYYNGIGSLPVE